MYGTDANADGNNRQTTFKITSTKLYVHFMFQLSLYQLNIM